MPLYTASLARHLYHSHTDKQGMSHSSKATDLSAYRQMVQDTLQRLQLDKRTPQALYAPIQYTLEQEGAKRVRPVLALLMQAFLRPEAPLVISPAVALEVFHNFTLLHDDVMDNSLVRRGKPSVYAKYGLTPAILSGDAMLILAYQMLTEEVSPEVLSDLMSDFNKMATLVMEGQQLDLEYERLDNVSKEQYLEMIGYKTAVLIATATRFGAILSKVDIELVEYAYNFGWNLGIAFQLQDDYLDLYGDSETFGKPLGGDILEGKKTILHTLAYVTASQAQRQALTEAMRRPNEQADEKISKVKALYDEMEVATQVQALVRDYLAKAQKALESLESFTGREATLLRAFVSKLAERNT